MRSDWPYVALCLVIPLLWGVAAARLFDWWQVRRRRNAPAREDSDTDMYYI